MSKQVLNRKSVSLKKGEPVEVVFDLACINDLGACDFKIEHNQPKLDVKFEFGDGGGRSSGYSTTFDIQNHLPFDFTPKDGDHQRLFSGAKLIGNVDAEIALSIVEN